MEDLIQQIMDRAGITEQQANEAVHAMKDFIMGKVPPMFSGFVEKFFTEKPATDHEHDPLS